MFQFVLLQRLPIACDGDAATTTVNVWLAASCTNVIKASDGARGYGFLADLYTLRSHRLLFPAVPPTSMFQAALTHP